MAAESNRVEYLIVGAGMSGICMAAMLLKRGERSFAILERSQEVGGTWLENHYPNSGCDVPSYLYSFSFAPKHDWSQKYARQPEILQYFRDVSDQLGIRPFISFGQTVTEARFSNQTKLWTVTTSSGQTWQCRFLVSAVGQLSTPATPRFEGAELYQGKAWHSARWPGDADVTGKTVAVVGNGASTIQFLPEVVRKAKHVTLYQRHPSWIHPLKNPRYSDRWHRMMKRFPVLQSLYRGYIYMDCEYRIIALWDTYIAHTIYRWWLDRNMRSKIRKDLQPVLVPNYPPGCKRILLSSDFLETVQQPNVTIETASIERLTQNGLVTKNGETQVDCIIYGTGFETHPLVSTLNIINGDGVSLRDAWSQFPSTYYGLATPNFPNLFFLYGPNTNLGHNSIIYMVETQVQHVLNLLQESASKGTQTVEVRKDAVEQFVALSQRKLKKSAWGAGCSSWYKSADGTIPNNWYTSTLWYRWCLRKPTPDHWLLR
ncbi:MAG: NAD(P)/FAD-dependent oxidoreductase [Planctomycetaceae bacterium]|nr:NAD(P)/FAD-dependent oxidoreductase [Planctomycetaceae bacterium]